MYYLAIIGKIFIVSRYVRFVLLYDFESYKRAGLRSKREEEKKLVLFFERLLLIKVDAWHDLVLFFTCIYNFQPSDPNDVMVSFPI